MSRGFRCFALLLVSTTLFACTDRSPERAPERKNDVVLFTPEDFAALDFESSSTGDAGGDAPQRDATELDGAADPDATEQPLDGASMAGGPCEEGALEQRPCGWNQRGAWTRRCQAGGWSGWSSCQDPDVCADGASESSVCGANGAGTRQRSCKAGKWQEFSACADTDQCKIGTTTSGSCGLNNRGVSQLTCPAGVWSTVSCSDPDQCRDQSTGSKSCGASNTGRIQQTCSNGQWSAWSACLTSERCSAPASESRSCGYNARGNQSRTCASGVWTDFNACVDPDECRDGTSATRACGFNMRGSALRSCAAGRWGVYGACNDPDTCRDGTSEQRACGINGRGAETRSCDRGRLSAWSLCVDPDQCTDGAIERRSCGVNERGSERRACVTGSYGDWSTCVDADRCRDGSLEREACGPQLAGERTRTCSMGAPGVWSSCSVSCGDGVVQSPETCDDRGTVDGDGCSADCRIERVRWIAQIPGTPRDGAPAFAPLRSGRLCLVTSYGAVLDSAALSDHAPTLNVLDADGRLTVRRDLRVSTGTSFAIERLSVSDSGQIQLAGDFAGSSDLFGDTNGHTQRFARAFSADGTSSTGALMAYEPSGESTRPVFEGFSAAGDYFAQGRFEHQETLRLVNGRARYPSAPGIAFYFMRANPLFDSVSANALSVALPGSGNANVALFAAANEGSRQALLFRGRARSYRFGNAEFGQDSESVLAHFDTDSQLSWHYAFPYIVQSARLSLLPSGDTIAEVQLFSDPAPAAQIADESGQQAVSSRGAVLWFSSEGRLLVARSGRFVAQRADGSIVVRGGFTGDFVLAPNTPSARTLRGNTAGPAEYLASYDRAGELLSARVIVSRIGNELWSADKMIVGSSDFVLATPCDRQTRFGEQGALTITPGPSDVGWCIMRVGFDGNVAWVVPSSFNGTSTDRVLRSGDQVWLLTENRHVSRYGASGARELALDLQAYSSDLAELDGNVWALVRVSPTDGRVAPSDPRGSVLDAARGEVAVVALRR